MASLFDIANSGLQAYRKGLSVTGQNIANINTEGFKRREANLEEVTSGTGGVQSSGSQVGLGVRVGSIRRSFDTYLQTRVRTTLAQFEKQTLLLAGLKKLKTCCCLEMQGWVIFWVTFLPLCKRLLRLLQIMLRGLSLWKKAKL